MPVDAERVEKLAGAELHQADFGGHLKEQEALLHIAPHLFRSSGGAAEEFAVAARGVGDARDGGFEQRGFVLTAAQARARKRGRWCR